MKTFKILFAAIIFVGFTSSAIGQISENASAEAKARVISAITIEVAEGNDLNFGQVFPDETKEVDLEGNTTHDLTEGVRAARFDIGASDGSSLTLEYTSLPAELSGTGDDIGITYNSGFGTNNDGSGTTNLDVDSPNNITSPGDDFYVFLGGEITTNTGQTPGEYSATVELTVEYN